MIDDTFDDTKPKLSLTEGQAMLKTLLKEVKYGPITIEKAQKRMEDITKDMEYPIDDTKRSVADGCPHN